MLTENRLTGDEGFSSHILCGTSNTSAPKSLLNFHTLTTRIRASTMTSMGTVHCLHHFLTHLFKRARQYTLTVWNTPTWQQTEPLKYDLSVSRQWYVSVTLKCGHQSFHKHKKTIKWSDLRLCHCYFFLIHSYW